MKTFLIVWSGQLVSLLGSALTSFALGVWIYQHSGSATEYAWSILFFTLPQFLILPFAGTVVDRGNHRWIMIVSDLGAGLTTLAITLILFGNHLQVWHIYLANTLNSSFNAFQSVAYTAATTSLISKEQLHQVGGLRQLAQASAQLIAPLLAGVLIAIIQLKGILLIDFVTFLFALVTLLAVRFPLTKGVTTDSHRTSVVQDMLEGVRYILNRRALVALFSFSAGTDLLMGTVEVLFTPLILSTTSATILGILLSLGGLGVLVGSLALSFWGGSQKLIDLVLMFTGLCGLSIFAVGFRASVWLYSLAIFLFMFGITVTETAQQVTIQKTVDREIQGRILSLKSTTFMGATTFAYLVAGPLVDHIFSPLMVSDGLLAGSIGKLIGVGLGRGISLMFIVMGLLTILGTLVAYQYSPLRLVENHSPSTK